MEGSKPTDLNYRNNNPGNLRYNPLHPEYTPNAVGVGEMGFARYASWDDGVRDLDRQIQLDASRGLTLESFIYKFAPSSENNTQNYLSYLINKLGFSRDTRLSSIISDSGTDKVLLDSDIFSGDDSDSVSEVGTINIELVIILVIGGIVGSYVLLK